MAVAERPAPPLNTDQVDVILAEGLQRELIETDVEGQLPSDPAERLKMAQTLVMMADQHFQAGSREENVKAILFIAEVDLAPNHNTQGEDVAESGMGGLEDSVLVKVERSMTEFDGEEPSDELREIRIEIERRELPTPWKAESNGHAAEPEAEAPTDDAMIERKNLEDELVGRGLDPSEVTTLSDETLRWIVDHPEPATKKEEEAEAPAEPQTIETTHVVIPGAKSEEPVPPAEPEPKAEAEPPISSTLSPEREELESQISGPVLKAYGRGRKDVPGIGDHELRFMVEHPDGKVTREQLDAAKALDTGDVAPAESEPETPPAAEEAAAEEAASEPEPTPEPEAAQPEQPEEAAPEAEPETPAPAPEESEPEPDPDLHVPEEAKRDAREYFDAMIEKEHLPLPPEITEKPPVLPFDMSKCSYDEVFSLHARFHACEARMNFLITHEEDSLGDLEKLRTARELVVAAALPATIDGKRITDAQRAARVAADPQVQVYITAEHNIAKTLRKQKVLSNNYHRDCERSSRQLTKWTKEFGGSA